MLTTIAECHTCGTKYHHVHIRGRCQECERCGTLLECGTESCRQPIVAGTDATHGRGTGASEAPSFTTSQD